MQNYKNDFSILKDNKYAYLDSGATTQKPDSVVNAVKKYYEEENANPHRGAYSLSVMATEAYDGAHRKVAEFINAKSQKEIIFSKNATESLNLIAYSYGLDILKEGDEVVISIMEHHSDLVPWQQICKKLGVTLKYLYIDENYEIPESEWKEKITNNTKIVGITHVSNVTGTINPVRKITEYAHSKGAIVIVDGSQSVPHMKVDVQDIDCDFLVFSGHKMLAPMGIGVLYGKQELLENMTPFLMGGDMIEYVKEQETTFAELPMKFEAGTQNVGGAVGLSAAIDYINKVGFDEINRIEKEVTNYAIEELKMLNYIDLYVTSNLDNHQAVVSFNIKGIHPHDVATILNTENVHVRSGNHCAQPLLRYLGIDSTIRASFYLYNTKEDVDRLINALEKAYNMFERFLK